MNRSRPSLTGAAVALALAVPMFAHAEAGKLMAMTVTTKMRMPGTPMANMPPMTHTNKVCTSTKRPTRNR